VDLELDEPTRGAIETIRGLGREHLRPLGIEADRLERPIPPDHEFFQMLARAGYMERGPRSLDAAGGLDAETAAGTGRRTGRAVRNVLVSEEGAYWDRGALVTLPGPGLGGPPVASMGTPAQQDRFLGIFATRERPLWAAFAMTEPGAGSDVARIQTRARRDGDEWVLSGQKMFSSNSARAAWVVVWATVDPDLGRNGHRAFVVERGTPGFEVLRVEHKMGVRAYETASFALDDCRVPAENLLGGEAYYEGRANRGFGGAMATFNATRPVVAVHAIGIARAAHDHALAFVRDEVPAHAARRRRRALERLAEIRRGIEIGRLLCLHAAALVDAGVPNGREAATAKMYAPPVARAAIETAADILGEVGVRRDRHLEKLVRDVKMLDIGEGTQQVQRRIVARQVIGTDVVR
jgi:acyl-CoA dehydrogenase